MRNILLRSLIALFLCFGAAGTLWAKKVRIPVALPKINKKTLQIERKNMNSDADLRDNVKTNGNGDVWIDGIPMVDQGSRPQCAVAVVQRLLQYYSDGSHVSTANLAKALGYDKSNGTNLAFLVQALQKYSPELRLRFSCFYAFMRTVKELSDTLQAYNHTVPPRNALKIPDYGELQALGFTPFISSIRYDSWKALRCKDASDQRKAFKAIMAAIQTGIPVVWGVNLGLYRELGTKMAPGGHLRLIIGYNDKKGDIFYSDTWGRGHEKKRMDWDDAWAISFQMMLLSPMN